MSGRWKITGLCLALGLSASVSTPQATNCVQPPPGCLDPKPCPEPNHPHPQPLPMASCQSTQGNTTTVITCASCFPPSKPFLDPPGTNLLPTVYTNLFDSSGAEIPNTLPSTPTVPYNLHDGNPVVSDINPTSPTDDLQHIFTFVPQLLGREGRDPFDERKVRELLQLGIDILEGNPLPRRAYSGFPLLHYTGPEKVKTVVPVVDSNGKVTGGNVDVHQIWYDGRIESDTAFLDVSKVPDAPWTVTYTLDVLNRGEDDFSPYVMYFDVPKSTTANPSSEIQQGMGSPPLAGMDQSFFPMEDGTRTILKVKMAPGRYYSLVYTWGWRVHPPRAQVMEDASKVINGMTLPQIEASVFGPAPTSSEQAKLAAIAKIGDLAPAKRMWTAFREARTAADKKDWKRVLALLAEGREAFLDWKERTQLPRGVKPDPDSDITLLYVNNTIYGELTAGTLTQFPNWQTRGTWMKATLYNGDYFDHGYQSVDFGGNRGWENQFKSSVKYGGSGCWFTFGRNYWWANLKTPVTVPAASPYGPPSTQKVRMQFNYDPSRRLRFYQFDPMHHDVAIFSVH